MPVRPVILNNTPLVALWLITAVSPFIAQLQTNGLYFAPELLAKTFHLAQENP